MENEYFGFQKIKPGPPFTELASFDPSIATALANAIVPEHYDIDLYRQEIFPPHINTTSVILRNRTDPATLVWDGNPDGSEIVDYPLFKFYEPLFNPIFKIIESRFHISNYGAMMVKLPAGQNVGVHRDKGNYREFCSRLHIPLQTHPDVIMSCGDSEIHMELGKIYEINNTRWKHGVVNPSSVDRIHLIVDVFGSMRSSFKPLA
jgi:hypothetical protein